MNQSPDWPSRFNTLAGCATMAQKAAVSGSLIFAGGAPISGFVPPFHAPSATRHTARDSTLFHSQLSPAGLRTGTDRKTPKNQCRVTKLGDNAPANRSGAALLAILSPRDPRRWRSQHRTGSTTNRPAACERCSRGTRTTVGVRCRSPSRTPPHQPSDRFAWNCLAPENHWPDRRAGPRHARPGHPGTQVPPRQPCTLQHLELKGLRVTVELGAYRHWMVATPVW